MCIKNEFNLHFQVKKKKKKEGKLMDCTQFRKIKYSKETLRTQSSG